MPDDIARWLTGHARPLGTLTPGAPHDDLEPLGDALRDVRIVGLGESTHGTREFFRLKHRIAEFLVREAGFTTLALEAGASATRALDTYVRHGTGDPTRLIPAWDFGLGAPRRCSTSSSGCAPTTAICPRTGRCASSAWTPSAAPTPSKHSPPTCTKWPLSRRRTYANWSHWPRPTPPHTPTRNKPSCIAPKPSPDYTHLRTNDPAPPSHSMAAHPPHPPHPTQLRRRRPPFHLPLPRSPLTPADDYDGIAFVARSNCSRRLPAGDVSAAGQDGADGERLTGRSRPA